MDIIYPDFKFGNRYEKCRKYAKSLNKPSRTDLVTIRVKESFKLEDLELIFNRYEYCSKKRNKNEVSYSKLTIVLMQIKPADCQEFWLPGESSFQY